MKSMQKMSDHIPFDIQVEIIKRFPVKTLLKFRTVSKPWKKLIDSSKFIIEKFRNTQPQRFLIRYNDDGYKYVSIADDDAFPENSFISILPLSVDLLEDFLIIGSSLGLFCLFGSIDTEWETNVAVIWNPTIKKAVSVSVPNVEFPDGSVFGFGVCRVTCDPKFVKISDISKQMVENRTSFPWDVEVYALSTRVWRRPLSNLPRKWIVFDWPRFQVVVDGVIYWSGDVSSDLNISIQVIVSFNLTNEEFREIHIPGCLAHQDFSINMLRESLVLLHCNMELEPDVLKVWMMDHGGSNSFTKIFTIHMPYESIWEVMGFRKNDQLILEIIEEYGQLASLEVYDPTEDTGVDIGIYGHHYLYFVSSYTESLLLLDQPDN